MGYVLSADDRTIRSRYEIKYLVSAGVADEIRRFIAPFMVPDSFAEGCDGHRYAVGSLYFDTVDLRQYKQTVAGEKNRFKLRVRAYTDDPESPVFLEVKRRVNDAILKRRARLPRAVALEVLAGASIGEISDELRELANDLDFFTAHVRVSAARPFLRVRYLREAYQMPDGDPFRLTLDTDIECLPTLNLNFDLGGEGWLSTPVPGTVLELKFEASYPPWAQELIRVFALQRQSVAKYVISVDRCHAESGVPLPGLFPSQEPRFAWDRRRDPARERE